MATSPAKATRQDSDGVEPVERGERRLSSSLDTVGVPFVAVVSGSGSDEPRLRQLGDESGVGVWERTGLDRVVERPNERLVADERGGERSFTEWIAVGLPGAETAEQSGRTPDDGTGQDRLIEREQRHVCNGAVGGRNSFAVAF